MDICEISSGQFNLSIPVALTKFWTELTSGLAVMLIHYVVLLEAVSQWVTESVSAHGSKTSSEFLGYKD